MKSRNFEWQVEKDKKELKRQLEIQARDAVRMENERLQMNREYELKKLRA